MAICSVMVNGIWKTKPIEVKLEFQNHFSSCSSNEGWVVLGLLFPRIFLVGLQRSRLLFYASFSCDEIKQATWDYENEKGLGPIGFSFRFLKQYLELIKQHVFNLVWYFQDVSHILQGCNPSFFSLIPKVNDSKFTSNFHPISLIASI